MSWTTVQGTPAAPRGMFKPQRCSVCRAIVPMPETAKHDREQHLRKSFTTTTERTENDG